MRPQSRPTGSSSTATRPWPSSVGRAPWPMASCSPPSRGSRDRGSPMYRSPTGLASQGVGRRGTAAALRGYDPGPGGPDPGVHPGPAPYLVAGGRRGLAHASEPGGGGTSAPGARQALPSARSREPGTELRAPPPTRSPHPRPPGGPEHGDSLQAWGAGHGVLLADGMGQVVARPARQASAEWRPRLPAIKSIRAVALLRRRHTDGNPRFREARRSEAWEVPLVEVRPQG